MSTSTTQPLIKTPKQHSQMSNPKTTTMKDKTLTSLGNLIKLLPTGTVFIYQFLNPVLTNNGKCNTIHKYLSGVLFALCSFSCCFASFTDSYTNDGETHYGIVTKNGLWPYTGKNEEVDFSKYKLRVGDFVHALMALVVFMVLSLLNTNTVECFYPSFESTEKMLLMVLPPVLGAMAGIVFVVFPNTRHGIGYPTTPTSSSSS